MFQSAPGLIRPGDIIARVFYGEAAVSIRARPDQAGRLHHPKLLIGLGMLTSIREPCKNVEGLCRQAVRWHIHVPLKTISCDDARV